MPSHTVHCKVSVKLFGKSYYKVHLAIDSAYWIFGRMHRKYYHDNFSAMVFAKHFYPGDARAVQAAKFHLQLDEMCSENQTFRKWLESWAKKRVKKRSPNKKVKAKKPLPDGMAQLFTNVEKLAEIARLKKLLEEW
jgi:hypothetical protein